MPLSSPGLPDAPRPRQLLEDHVSDDLLEAYAMGKSLGKDDANVYVHLSVCDVCCLRAVREVEVLGALLQALQTFKDREVEAAHNNPEEASSSSRNPMASRKALRTAAG